MFKKLSFLFVLFVLFCSPVYLAKAQGEGYVILFTQNATLQSLNLKGGVEVIGSDQVVPASQLASPDQSFDPSSYPDVKISEGYQFYDGLVSPDGSQLIYTEAICDDYSCSSPKVWLVDTSSHSRYWLKLDPSVFFVPVAWSSLTNEVIFSTLASKEEGQPYELYAYNVVSETIRQLYLGRGQRVSITFLSPDQRYLLFESLDEATSSDFIKVYDLVSQSLFVLTQSSSNYALKGWVTNATLDNIRGKASDSIGAQAVPEATSGFQWPYWNDGNGWDYKDCTTLPDNPGDPNYCPPDVFHPGEDMNGPDGGNTDCGDDILAVANGQVVDVDTSKWGGIVIQHLWKGVTIYSQYGHVASSLVAEGQNITKGQHIAEMGNTSWESIYCHLHFEIRENDHPNPTYGSSWPTSILQSTTEIEKYYESPLWWVDNHGSYSSTPDPTPTSSIPPTIVPTPTPTTPPSGVWGVQFYTNPDGCLNADCNPSGVFYSPTNRPLAQIHEYYGNGKPDGQGNSDQWGSKWVINSTWFNSGTYIFRLNHNDGAKVFLDSQNIMDVWGNSQDGNYSCQTLYGNKKVTVLWKNTGAEAKLDFWWELDTTGFCNPTPTPTPTATATTPNTNCSNYANSGIVLFEHADCLGGFRQFSGSGPYNLINFNDQTSSVYVENSNWSVRVYAAYNYNGVDSRCVSGTMSNLAGIYYDSGPQDGFMNDTISSIRVYTNNNCDGNPSNTPTPIPTQTATPANTATSTSTPTPTATMTPDPPHNVWITRDQNSITKVVIDGSIPNMGLDLFYPDGHSDIHYDLWTPLYPGYEAYIPDDVSFVRVDVDVTPTIGVEHQWEWFLFSVHPWVGRKYVDVWIDVAGHTRVSYRYHQSPIPNLHYWENGQETITQSLWYTNNEGDLEAIIPDEAESIHVDAWIRPRILSSAQAKWYIGGDGFWILRQATPTPTVTPTSPPAQDEKVFLPIVFK